MTVQTIYDFLNTYCPFELAEEWDNPGLNVGNQNRPVSKVLLALDVTLDVIDYAKQMGADLILTHHPVIFEPLTNLNDSTAEGARVLALAQSGLAHIACHTNLDAACGGVNDVLAGLCGLTDVQPVAGLGRMGKTDTTLAQLAEQLKAALPANTCVGVCCKQQVRRVAVIGGSGGSLIPQIAAEGCDTLVTGEAKYSQLLSARELGVNVLVLGHYETEYPVLAPLADALAKAFPALTVCVMPQKAPVERF